MKGGMKDKTGRYSFEFFLFLPVKTRRMLMYIYDVDNFFTTHDYCFSNI